MIKKTVVLLIVSALILQCFALCGCSSHRLQFFDKNGKALAATENADITKSTEIDAEIKAYIEIAFNEAVSILAEKEKCEAAEAKEKLVSGGYSVYTHFDKKVFTAIKDTYNSENYKQADFGCAVTNNSGQLLAAYSSSDGETNFAITPTPPYSSIKPLSVYAPAIQSGIACWSKTYTDTPIKKVTDIDGNLVDWPSNANGKYANEGITVYEAIKKSLNTISIKCLKDYGVTRSVEFLKAAFDFPLDMEETIISQYGEEEVLGNLGMGYLREGVSPVDMAGYYQIFANGGKYYKPTAIYEIKDNSGKSIYKRNVSINQVIEKSTADIMNLLLQEVVSENGTGKDAMINGLAVGGKTGTGEKGNWFVGFTPEYTCAVWHSTQLEKNYCCKIFSKILNNVPDKKLTSFSVGSDVKKAVYCCISGDLAGINCTDNAVGYFDAQSMPQECRLH